MFGVGFGDDGVWAGGADGAVGAAVGCREVWWVGALGGDDLLGDCLCGAGVEAYLGRIGFELGCGVGGVWEALQVAWGGCVSAYVGGEVAAGEVLFGVGYFGLSGGDLGGGGGSGSVVRGGKGWTVETGVNSSGSFDCVLHDEAVKDCAQDDRLVASLRKTVSLKLDTPPFPMKLEGWGTHPERFIGKVRVGRRRWGTQTRSLRAWAASCPSRSGSGRSCRG